MDWVERKILICQSAPGVPGANGCSDGEQLTTAVVYVATGNPSLPAPEVFDIALFGFIFPVAAYLTAMGLKTIFTLFRPDKLWS